MTMTHPARSEPLRLLLLPAAPPFQAGWSAPEEHGGTLSLENAPVFAGETHFGAMAVITLPLAAPTGTPELETHNE